MVNEEKLYELLIKSAQLFPDNTALVYNDESISYKALHKFSNELQSGLSSIGIQTGGRIAIYADKSIDFVASVFGILKNNCTYIPIDASAPMERNKYIISNCKIHALLTDEQYISDFKDDFEIAGKFGSLILLKNKARGLEPSSGDLAYILYTSGSTGNPKGVMYSHYGALSFINWCSAYFQLDHRDIFASHAPFHFDLSVFDLFVCIKKGGTLIIIPEKTAKQPMLLVKLISDQKISVWYSTPTILKLMTEYGKIEKYDLTSLKTILFAGEVYPPAQFLKLYAKMPAAKYYNLYGPTETNVCLFYEIKDAAKIEDHIPLGEVCPYYKAKIAHDKNEGELLISGSALMSGYWAMPSLTEEKTVTDREGNKWYKTGDVVLKNSQGLYVFKGRTDRMIKRNGYRIELDEIEKTLVKNEDILSCASISIPAEENTVKIISYIVTKNNVQKSLIELKALCTKLLPGYMIPDDFIITDALPITSGNKIDYQKLIRQLL